MPLSEHEQRMLDQIESALYAEDPKFASHVRSGRMRTASSKRRFQAAALFVLGLVLLVAGVALSSLQLGGFPVVSVVGFVFMFGAGVLFLLGGSRKGAAAPRDDSADESSGTKGSGQKPKSGRKGGGFTSRMEDRFRRRFEQE